VIELAVICGLLVALQAWTTVDRQKERREVAAERRDLLLRIQAPEVVITQAANGAASQAFGTAIAGLAYTAAVLVFLVGVASLRGVTDG